MEAKQESKKKQFRPSSNPGVEMSVRLNNLALAGKLRHNSEKINSKLSFLMLSLPTRNIPRQVIQDVKWNITNAIETMGNSAKSEVGKLNAAISKQDIPIPKREQSPGKVIRYVSNNRAFSEIVFNINLLDQAIWVIRFLSISLIITEEKQREVERYLYNLLSATEAVINNEYKRVIGLLKSNGKVNEIAVAMPVDKGAIPEPLNHPLIEIEGIHKFKNELVVVNHPVGSYADKKTVETANE